MAEEKDLDLDGEEGEGESEAPKGDKKSKKMVLIIFAAIFVLSIGGTVTAVLFLLGDDEPQVTEANTETESAPEKEEAIKKNGNPALFLKLSPAFVVNFKNKGKQRYLQAHLTVMARDQEVLDAVSHHLPLIRNNLILLFASESLDELKTLEGKEALRAKLTISVQEVLTKETGSPGIEQVLFANFVMQ